MNHIGKKADEHKKIAEELLAAKKSLTSERPSASDDYSSTSNTATSQKRKQSCGGCPGCISEGCNECKFCLDKKKNSGPGLKRQCCVKRRCIRIAKNEADIDNAISQLCQLQDQYGFLENSWGNLQLMSS